MRKRFIVYVTQGEDGAVERVGIPMRYVYLFVAAALVGMFSIAGMAGSYSRMLVKAESINRMRDELAMTRKDYAGLEEKAHEKDVQEASLGALATEVSAIYGLTAGTLTHLHVSHSRSAAMEAAKAPLKNDSTSFNDDSYYKSLNTYYALKTTADEGFTLEQPVNPNYGVRSVLSDFASPEAGVGRNVPNMWPVMGPITSGFGEREDPILGNGEGEFHEGVDIGGANGTSVHAPAGGRVVKTGLESGYGRVIEIDHGNGIETLYAHLQGYNVVEGETVVKGQVIGYLGHSGGRVTGPNLHYEVHVHGVPVNPRKYLQTTMAHLGGMPGAVQ